MLLQGVPPEDSPDLSFVVDPEGSLVGFLDRPAPLHIPAQPEISNVMIGIGPPSSAKTRLHVR